MHFHAFSAKDILGWIRKMHFVINWIMEPALNAPNYPVIIRPTGPVYYPN
jgi:hypothetical protein